MRRTLYDDRIASVNQIFNIQSLAQGFLNIRLTPLAWRSNLPEMFYQESSVIPDVGVFAGRRISEYELVRRL